MKTEMKDQGIKKGIAIINIILNRIFGEIKKNMKKRLIRTMRTFFLLDSNNQNLKKEKISKYIITFIQLEITINMFESLNGVNKVLLIK